MYAVMWRSHEPTRSEAERRSGVAQLSALRKVILMTINNISGTDYSSVIAQTQTGGLESTLGSIDKTKATDDEMMNACKEFEAYMIEQVYKSMEKTIIKADEDENEYETYFGDMRIQQYAKSVVDQGGVGLAQQLYEAMKRNSGPTTLTEATTE